MANLEAFFRRMQQRRLLLLLNFLILLLLIRIPNSAAAWIVSQSLSASPKLVTTHTYWSIQKRRYAWQPQRHHAGVDASVNENDFSEPTTPTTLTSKVATTISRRDAIAVGTQQVASVTALATGWWCWTLPWKSSAMETPIMVATPTAAKALVTDTFFIRIRGLPSADTASSVVDGNSINNNNSDSNSHNRIVIGLFGNDAPNSVRMLKQLVSAVGLPALCRPKAERALQKEQLEANKVYNTCLEHETEGVSLIYSTIWRIRHDARIDVGAVKGKYVSREYPEWREETPHGIKHDMAGVVSVRRGHDGGFGFTIYPGNGELTTTTAATAAQQELDTDHIVVGRVLEGMDIVQQLNHVPVVVSSSVNYMSLTGGPKVNHAPDRSCRYGGPMYCNENKPLVKLSIVDAGVL